MQNYLEEIIADLHDAKVEFIICGGVAVVLQGVERMTIDLDISVKRESENLKNFLSVMKRGNLVPRNPLPPEALLNDELLDHIAKEKNAIVFSFIDVKNPFKVVDVFIIPDLSFEKLEKDSQILQMGSRSVKVLSKEKLIELKSAINPVRDKDTLDINSLKRIIQHGK